jgi:type VI secretion system secreted protein VgrG
MASIILNQQNRLMTLDTPLGKDVLVPTLFNGIEAFSTLFEFKISAVSTNENITADQILGKNVTLSVTRPESESREFNGIVASFSASYAVVRGTRAYELILRPEAWLLTRTSDCRIFQNKTILQITDTIFSENGITNYKKKISGSHPSREYCVQHRETDFDFLFRIWAEEGVYFYFDHKKNQHSLILSDSCNGYCECLDKDVVHAPTVQSGVIAIKKWANDYNYVSGKYTLDDYNFEQPSTDLTSTTNTTLSNSNFKKWELYDYPGDYTQKSDGQNLSRDRMENIESGYSIARGEATYRGFMPGAKIKMTKHEVKSEENKSYVISYVEHSIIDESRIGNYSAIPSSYSNIFKALPDTTVFRPPPVTRRPLIPGPQTAKVVGPSGEEIYCDKYGRIKVQFHWDREGKNNENSSCWIRVGQIFAGSSWGTIFTPRIGMEVIVAFLNGDPDQPLIVGCVYNQDNMPPYALPDQKTQSGIKTRSTTKGSASTYNEMRIEDKKDSELFYFRAQKDFQREITQDDTLTVSKGNKSSTISQGNVSMEINSGNYDLTLGSGNATVKCNSGSILLQAQTNITLKVGSNEIVISQEGISITGTNVTSKASANSTTEGAIVKISGSGSTEVTASGMLTLKGALVQIN